MKETMTYRWIIWDWTDVWRRLIEKYFVIINSSATSWLHPYVYYVHFNYKRLLETTILIKKLIDCINIDLTTEPVGRQSYFNEVNLLPEVVIGLFIKKMSID